MGVVRANSAQRRGSEARRRSWLFKLYAAVTPSPTNNRKSKPATPPSPLPRPLGAPMPTSATSTTASATTPSQATWSRAVLEPMSPFVSRPSPVRINLSTAIDDSPDAAPHRAVSFSSPQDEPETVSAPATTATATTTSTAGSRMHDEDDAPNSPMVPTAIDWSASEASPQVPKKQLDDTLVLVRELQQQVAELQHRADAYSEQEARYEQQLATAAAQTTALQAKLDAEMTARLHAEQRLISAGAGLTDSDTDADTSGVVHLVQHDATDDERSLNTSHITTTTPTRLSPSPQDDDSSMLMDIPAAGSAADEELLAVLMQHRQTMATERLCRRQAEFAQRWAMEQLANSASVAAAERADLLAAVDAAHADAEEARAAAAKREATLTAEAERLQEAVVRVTGERDTLSTQVAAALEQLERLGTEVADMQRRLARADELQDQTQRLLLAKEEAHRKLERMHVHTERALVRRTGEVAKLRFKCLELLHWRAQLQHATGFSPPPLTPGQKTLLFAPDTDSPRRGTAAAAAAVVPGSGSSSTSRRGSVLRVSAMLDEEEEEEKRRGMHRQYHRRSDGVGVAASPAQHVPDARRRASSAVSTRPREATTPLRTTSTTIDDLLAKTSAPSTRRHEAPLDASINDADVPSPGRALKAFLYGA